MKKTLTLIIALIMIFSLAACGSTPAVTSPTDIETPPPSDSPSPEVTPPVTATGRLGELLADVLALETGSAGSSLRATAAGCALLEWEDAYDPSPASVTADAKAFYDALTAEQKTAFGENLADVFYAAMQTCGTGGAELISAAGVTMAPGADRNDDDDARELFAAVYAGTDLTAPVIASVYSSDSQLERFEERYYIMDSLSAENLVALLVNKEVLASGVAVLSFDATNRNNLRLDLSADFSAQLNSQGTSGEYMLMGSLVNSFLETFDAEGMTVTVNGQTLESGHSVYDFILDDYDDNVYLD